MKKITKLFAAIIAVCTLSLGIAFAGCANDDRENQDGTIENGYSIVYAFTAEADKNTAAQGTMLNYMNSLKTSGDLTFEGLDGSYGFYITSVLGVRSKAVSSTANSYSGWDWAVYTTVTTIDGVTYSDDGTKFDYNGVTFYKSSYGVSSLPCVTGESYALVYEFSSMTW